MSSRGHLWVDLESEIADEFSALVEASPEPTPRDAARIVDDLLRVNIGEMRAARARIGEEWWRRMAEDAEERSRAVFKEANDRRAAVSRQMGRPRGGALSTPRLDAKRADDRAVQNAKRNRRRAMRERLPDERPGLTHHFTITTKAPDDNGISEVDGYIQTGLYGDGRVGEIFVKIARASGFEMVDQWAICFSMALQNGVALEDLCNKFRGQRLDPCGPTSNKDIPRCTSIVDYVARYLLLRYCGEAAAKGAAA